MAINEVFSNPTVEQVIFQILFPNYFGIEKIIGDFQLEIMSKFPKSKLLYKQQFAILQSKPEEDKSSLPTKIWQFKTEKEDITLNISSDSLDISSEKHKTYNNSNVSSDERFREIIIFVVDRFLKLAPIKNLLRMGLRYIDNCPLPDPLTKESFLSYYNSSLHLDNLKITDINTISILKSEIWFVKSNNIFITFREQLNREEKRYVLDFDGKMGMLKTDDYLSRLDQIHMDISNTYETMIKEPVFKIMKQSKKQ